VRSDKIFDEDLSPMVRMWVFGTHYCKHFSTDLTSFITNSKAKI